MNGLFCNFKLVGNVDDNVIIKFLNASDHDVIFIDYNYTIKLSPYLLGLINDNIIYIEEDI